MYATVQKICLKGTLMKVKKKKTNPVKNCVQYSITSALTFLYKVKRRKESTLLSSQVRLQGGGDL